MGCYDEFVKGNICVQLKVGECLLIEYNEGDDVVMKDGIYIGHEGVVVIKDSKVIAIFSKDEIFSKWGDVLSCEEILNPHDYIKQCIDSVKENTEKKE